MMGAGISSGVFGAGITEHQTLIAGALFSRVLAFGSLGIDALGDVRALRGDGVHDEHAVGVEDIIVMSIANFTDGLGGDGAEVEFSLGGDFAADDDEVGLRIGFACDPAAGILRQAGIKHGIRDGIANLVRMAFANGFRREDKILLI